MQRVRKKCREKQGAAVLVAIFLMLILLVLSVTLLLGAYSMTHTMQGRRQAMQAKELAETLSVQLERELTEVQFSDAASEEASRSAGENAFWFYVKDQIRQGGWQPETEYTFSLAPEDASDPDATALLEEAGVTMQWKELSDGTIQLFVAVRALSGRESSEITSLYTLRQESYTGGEEESGRWNWRFAERR